MYIIVQSVGKDVGGTKGAVARGQGTFEYVLLLGGVLLIVVLALVVLQSTFQDSSTGLSDVQT
ncbi:MAG: class III signal peptide-containing protein, partial [Candidatus Micrarchaeota archaeon]|nr:class III signal peptide-containing protein [Candidatus Micrarchaeota archaeon]